MPRLGTIPLVASDTVAAAGAAFTLLSPASSDAFLSLDGSAEIEVKEGQRPAVVRFTNSADANTTFERGHRLAQQGLDLLSVLGKQDAAIQDAEDEHLLWWTEPSGLVLRLVSTSVFKLGVGSVTAIVRDKEGNVIPPTPARPRHHIAFRYYRLAQATDDLFDAYRNMYLAFEALLSSRYPMDKGEREIVWLRRALGAAATTVQLNSLGVVSGDDLVEALLDTIYRDARLPLFHAKEGRDYFAPQDSVADQAAVSRALAVLTGLVLQMAQMWYEARRARGGVLDGCMGTSEHSWPSAPWSRTVTMARLTRPSATSLILDFGPP